MSRACERALGGGSLADMGDETDRIRVKLANRRWDARRVGVTLAGFLVLLAGLAMLALPGPGLVVVALGFAILATEFVWAWRAHRYVQRRARDAGQRVRSWRDRGSLSPRR